MRFEHEEFLLHAVEVVYPLVRDRIEELLPHMPGIESVEVLSRTAESKGRTRVRSRWRLRPPALLTRVLPPAAFVWQEDALWIDKKRSVESQIHGFGYESLTRIVYEPASDWTRVRIAAEVRFDSTGIDVPRGNLETILAGAEQALRDAIEPNLTAFLEAIRERLGG